MKYTVIAFISFMFMGGAGVWAKQEVHSGSWVAN